MSIFTYEKPNYPDDCIFNISPSAIGRFFEYPVNWYREEVLGEEKEFQGNDSSIIGTICHAVYADKIQQKNILTREIINKDLYDTYGNRKDLNLQYIADTYPQVANCVMSEYFHRHQPDSVEEKILGKVKNGIYIGGTCDARQGSVVVDFKTVKIKPNENEIPFPYKIQLLAYAYIYSQPPYNKYINAVRIVYGVHPGVKNPARCYVVEEQIDFPAKELINDTLTLIADSILKIKEDPSLTYLIFKSMKLKK